MRLWASCRSGPATILRAPSKFQLIFETVIEQIMAGKTRAIDLVRVTSDRIRYFVNVSSGGFSGVVDEKLTPEMKRTWGPLAYLRSAAAAFSELRGYTTKVALDDAQAFELDLYNVVVANGRYVAGGIRSHRKPTTRMDYSTLCSLRNGDRPSSQSGGPNSPR